MKIGILALQGAFAEHEASLDKLHIPHFEIRQADDLQDDMDGLIIPGGESTVMGKLLKELSLYEPLKAKIEAGLPVFGTCAGLLLLAKDIDGEDALGFRQRTFIVLFRPSNLTRGKKRFCHTRTDQFVIAIINDDVTVFEQSKLLHTFIL